MKKIFVYSQTDAFMSAIIDQARNGYTRYVTGTVAQEKVVKLAAKMATFYKTDADRNERYRMKKSGLAPARLLVMERKSHADMQWILLVYGEGETPAVSEKLKDIRKSDRLVIKNFELVKRIDSKTAPKGKKGQCVRWTWRIVRATEQTIRERIIEAIRTHNDKELHVIQLELWGMPGFATIRQQIGKATALARAEWQRSRSEDWKGWPERLAYIKKRALVRVGQYWPPQ